VTMTSVVQRLRTLGLSCVAYCKKNPVQVALFWAIFALGLFARVFMFGEVPDGLNQDEAFAGYNAYTLSQSARDSFGYRLPVYLTAWGSGMNALESYLMVPFVALFGVKVWAIRIPMLLVGLLSIVATHRLVRHFSDERYALLAMLLVAIAPWHIMLSRWALESNLAPGFVLFGMLFFAKGMDKPKFLLLSSLCFGLSLYAYATVWSVVPFIVLFCVAYAVWCKSMTPNCYTFIALGILVALACPLLLFLLVNKGMIPEIRLPFLSIPKLVYFRDSEISFSQIPQNLMNLWNILKNQSDGLPWNSMKDFGLFYPVTLGFFFVGLIEFIVRAARDVKARKIGLHFFVLVWLMAGIAVGALINVNVNRVNLLFLPLIVVAAHGMVLLFDYIHPRTIIIPVVAYLLSFAGFEKEYFSTYRNIIGNHFGEGIESAMEFVNREAKDRKVVVDPNISYPKVLFLGGVDLDSYLSTVKYKNYPSAFLYVHSFDKYSFTDAMEQDRASAVYLMENKGHYFRALQNRGFDIKNFGNFIVGY